MALKVHLIVMLWKDTLTDAGLIPTWGADRGFYPSHEGYKMQIRKNGMLVAVAAATVALVATFVAPAANAGTSSAACANVGSGYLTQAGKTVEVFTSVVGDELTRYQNATKDFTACTGIKINWNGTNTFEAQLPVRVAGGTAPQLALIPQPGLIAKMVATGKAVTPPSAVTSNVNRYWSKSWRDLGSVGGKFYAAPNSANLKSLVWYSPKQFAKYGYTVPTTWTAMLAQSDKMAAAKQTAWCAGIGSAAATGWPATDWLEEVVVREAGSAVYNNWINHTVKFSDAPIVHAMNTISNWLGNSKYVGTVSTIATTTFQNAGLAIPTGGCMQLQQASFYGAQFPTGTVVSPTGDAWVYYLPGINPAVATPVEGGGEFYLAFSNDKATQEAQTYFSTPQWAVARIKAAGANGGWLSANTGVPATTYTQPLDSFSAKYLADKASTFVFDASDAMPAAVGAGAEWTQMTNWFAGGATSASIPTITKAIDAAWPAN
jgi:alpha-glucoside transport system substrate-binding protein